MEPSLFTVRVPLAEVNGSDDVFLMNTFSDAQLVVSRDVASLLDRAGGSGGLDSRACGEDERNALEVLAEHGFLVRDRAEE